MRLLQFAKRVPEDLEEAQVGLQLGCGEVQRVQPHGPILARKDERPQGGAPGGFGPQAGWGSRRIRARWLRKTAAIKMAAMMA